MILYLPRTESEGVFVVVVPFLCQFLFLFSSSVKFLSSQVSIPTVSEGALTQVSGLIASGPQSS